MYADCRDGDIDDFASMADQIQFDVHVLDLRENELDQLPDDVFGRYNDLEKLLLDDNDKLKDGIEEAAFRGLMKLKALHARFIKDSLKIFKDFKIR